MHNISCQFLHHFHPRICWALQNVQNLNIKSEKICIYNILSYILWGVSGEWAEWAIFHPSFGRIEGAAGQCSALLLAHPALCRQLFTPLYIQCKTISVFGSYIYILVREPKYGTRERPKDIKLSKFKLFLRHNYTQLTKLSRKWKITTANFLGTHFMTDLAHECDSHLKVFIHRVRYEYKKLSASCSKTC